MAESGINFFFRSPFFVGATRPAPREAPWSRGRWVVLEYNVYGIELELRDRILFKFSEKCFQHASRMRFVALGWFYLGFWNYGVPYLMLMRLENSEYFLRSSERNLILKS